MNYGYVYYELIKHCENENDVQNVLENLGIKTLRKTFDLMNKYCEYCNTTNDCFFYDVCAFEEYFNHAPYKKYQFTNDVEYPEIIYIDGSENIWKFFPRCFISYFEKLLLKNKYIYDDYAYYKNKRVLNECEEMYENMQ